MDLDFNHPLIECQLKYLQSHRAPTNLCSEKECSLLKQNFQEKCEAWLEFMNEIDQEMAGEILGSFQCLKEQQRSHKLFQNVKYNNELLHSVIEDGQYILDQVQVDNRDDFNLKLTLIRIQWEAVTILAQQRKELIDQRISKGQCYREMVEKLKDLDIFNEKKDFCAWLTQMENTFSHKVNISTEEAIEKLKKEYQYEISLALKPKNQILQIGESCAESSPETKLCKVNHYWQQLLTLTGEIENKLKVMFDVLDKNICRLRSMLLNTECELSKTIGYKTNYTEDIQRKLNEQQKLQRDIKKKSTYLYLCQALLNYCKEGCNHDQGHEQGNICTMKQKRRLKIEENSTIWQNVFDSTSKLENCPEISEKIAAFLNYSGLLDTVDEEKLKICYVFQIQTHDSLIQLNFINRNNTDSCKLDQTVHEENLRWNNLQSRAASILRSLNHFTNHLEVCQLAQDNILVWLIEMDLTLTNIKHFSACYVLAKIKMLKRVHQKTSLNNRSNQIIAYSKQSIQKSKSLDAALIEDLDKLTSYCLKVLSHSEHYQDGVSHLPLLHKQNLNLDKDEHETNMHSIIWHTKTRSGVFSLQPSTSNTLVEMSNLKGDGQGCDALTNMNSIPSEWNNSHDLCQDLDITVHQALSSDRENNQEKRCFFQNVESTTTELSMEAQICQLSKIPLNSILYLQEIGNKCCKTPSGPGIDSSHMSYMKLFKKCCLRMDGMRKGGKKLETVELPRFINVATTEPQSSGTANKALPINPDLAPDTLQDHYQLLKQIKHETFQDILYQKLVNAENSLAAKYKVCVNNKRQRVLLKEITHNLKEIEKLTDISNQLELSFWTSASDKRTLSKPEKSQSIDLQLSFLTEELSCRSEAVALGSFHSVDQLTHQHKTIILHVINVALPLQLLLLLLICLAYLVLLSEEDFSCIYYNYFA